MIIFDRIIANENLQTGTLIVEVAGLENDDGHVFTHLYDNLEYFPITCKNAFRKLVGKPSNGRCEFIYKEIPFGTYAMTTHHDENGNGLMDKNWIGLPKEGYGFSNDVNPLFSLPKFEKARFVLKEKILKIVIHMQY